MLKVYPAIFHEKDGYWVSFPDVEGCFSDGDTLADAMENAQEALALHLSTLLDDGITLPAPSLLEAIKADDGIASYVGCDPNKYRRNTKAIKKTLSIPGWLNEECESRHINFSSVLQKALLQEINQS